MKNKMEGKIKYKWIKIILVLDFCNINVSWNWNNGYNFKVEIVKRSWKICLICGFGVRK